MPDRYYGDSPGPAPNDRTRNSANYRAGRDDEPDIDDRWEGSESAHAGDDYDETDRGYDEAVHNGESRYGYVGGRGGVFGTTGGGTYDSGFQVVERPGLYDRSGADDSFDFDHDYERTRAAHGSDRFETVLFYDRGPHAGKGPKSYKRSDDRIREDVNERLTRHGEVDASDIEVSCENGEVTLTGLVESRREKRLAEAITETVFGVVDVHNRLKAKGGMFSRMLRRGR